MDEVSRAQTGIGRALRRARAAEDRALAGRVREEGERLAKLLSGVLAMARLHERFPSVEIDQACQHAQ